jgi:plastocyanin
MKKYLLFGAFALMISGFASGASVTISNSGFTFSPDNITINLGDTVVFQLAASHDAVEVSEATWNANGTSPLGGGFSVPFSGGKISGLTAGVHFYVCTVHASIGMKGKISVTGTSGISDNPVSAPKITMYPNPTSGNLTFEYSGQDNLSGNQEQIRLEIYNVLGERIFELPGYKAQTTEQIDLSSVPDGIYFVRINDRQKTYTEELIKK